MGNPVQETAATTIMTTTTTTTTTSTTTTTAVCSAIDGPAAGSACVFPFNFMGVLHFGCTTIDGDSLWCSTQTDANDNHVSGVGAWGYCDASCPIQDLEKAQLKK